MAAETYQRVAALGDVPVKTSLRVSVEGRDILLCHTDAGLFAVSNLCTHADALLHEGKLKGTRVLCPLHGAAFDVRDGAPLSRPATQPLGCYAVKIEGDAILLAVPGNA